MDLRPSFTGVSPNYAHYDFLQWSKLWLSASQRFETKCSQIQCSIWSLQFPLPCSKEVWEQVRLHVWKITSSNSLLMWTLIGSKKNWPSLQPTTSQWVRPPVSAMARSAASKASWYFSPRSAAWKNRRSWQPHQARRGKYIKLRYTEVVNIPFFMNGIFDKTIYEIWLS